MITDVESPAVRSLSLEDVPEDFELEERELRKAGPLMESVRFFLGVELLGIWLPPLAQ